MKGETIDIIDNLIQAVSILNKTEEYLESLTNGLSECDSLIADYYHFIENTDISNVNLEKLFANMQDVLIKRRTVKRELTLREHYKNLSGKLNNSVNRQFMIQEMKNVDKKMASKFDGFESKTLSVLTSQQIEELKIEIKTKKRRGRPPKKVVTADE